MCVCLVAIRGLLPSSHYPRVANAVQAESFCPFFSSDPQDTAHMVDTGVIPLHTVATHLTAHLTAYPVEFGNYWQIRKRLARRAMVGVQMDALDHSSKVPQRYSRS